LACIVTLDGAPPDPGVLDRMAGLIMGLGDAIQVNKPIEAKTEDRGAYCPPRLEVYGDLRALTQAHGIPTKPDSTVSRSAGSQP